MRGKAVDKFELGERMCVKVEKLSGRNLFFNERVLYADEKEIRYYSKVPKNFKRNDLKHLKNLPKTGIPTAACEIQYPSEAWLTKKNKRNVLRIIFPQGSQIFYFLENGRLVYRDKAKSRIRDLKQHAEKMKLKGTKKTQWVFVFSNSFELQKLARLIENVSKPKELLDLENIPKPAEDDPLESERKLNYFNRMGIKFEEENEDDAFVKKSDVKYEINEYEGNEDKRKREKLRKNMEIIRNKALLEEKRKEEALLIERKKKTEQMELQNKIQNNLEEKNLVELTWKINFQNYILENLKDSSLENSIELGVKLFHLVADFKHVRTIIDELCLPEIMRTNKPVKVNYPPKVKDQKAHIPCELVYVNDSYITKIGIPSSADLFGLLENEDDPKTIEEMQRREYQLEFKGLETILNVIIGLGEKLDSIIMVPLTCLIRYKGFMGIVTTNMNFKDSEIAFGEKKNQFMADPELMKSLSAIGKKLNIMPHTHKSRSSSSALIEVPISQGIVVYKTQKHTIESLLAKTDESIKQQLEQLNRGYEKKGDGNSNPEERIFYITNGMTIFPIDIDITKKSKYPTRHRLRPEFLKMYEYRLNPDTFDVKGLSKKSDQLESEMTNANKTLKNVMLKKLVAKLDRMEYLPLTSYGFTRVFHEFGVNMRYLGLATKMTRLPHIQEICMAEMVARSCKRLLFRRLTYTIVRSGQLVADVKVDVETMNGSKKRELIEQFNQELDLIVVRFLNDLFGKSDRTSHFWKVDLKEQVKYDYNYELDHKVDINYMPAGALLAACIYHLRLSLDHKCYLNIGKTEEPFILDDFKGFKIFSKCFKFKKHKLRKVTEYYSKHRDNKRYAMALRLLRIKLTIEESLGRVDQYVEVLGEIADLQLECEKLDESIEIANKALSIIDPYCPNTIKFICIILKAYIKKEEDQKVRDTFERAKNIIEYNFGIYHPLHATFHSFLAYFYFIREDYENSLDHYQSGVNDCLRILGVDHPLTGQLYLDIANVFLKMEKREKGKRYLSKAFQIFDTSKYEESEEKASLANQISVILFDFGSFVDSIEFASKSNQIYVMKNDMSYLPKIFDNRLIIAKCREMLEMNEEALDECYKTFIMITRKAIWKSSFGKYVVEILKVVFKIHMKSKTHVKKCNVYYILDLIHARDEFFMEELKEKCESKGGPLKFVRDMITTIFNYSGYFEVVKLVNNTYENFLKQSDNEVVSKVMADMKMLYFCVGPNFLLGEIKPLH